MGYQAEELVDVTIPADSSALLKHAYDLLRGRGMNTGKVHGVLPVSNKIAPGYEVILFESAGGDRRTAYLSYEKGSLKVATEQGWPFRDPD